MSAFISFSYKIREILLPIVYSDTLHIKWLNTLSYLENCGARKIAACEHPTFVKEEMLKHAAEEFRHAHYLKSQIQRISRASIDTYAIDLLLGKTATLHYLNALDLHTSRYLKTLGLTKSVIKEYSYLLVTYAIELRAEEFYPIYDELLRKTNSRIRVKSILLEEKEHLEEMQKGIESMTLGKIHAKQICAIEAHFCIKWLNAIALDISSGFF